jgi:hypothetical protein
MIYPLFKLIPVLFVGSFIFISFLCALSASAVLFILTPDFCHLSFILGILGNLAHFRYLSFVHLDPRILDPPFIPYIHNHATTFCRTMHIQSV